MITIICLLIHLITILTIIKVWKWKVLVHPGFYFAATWFISVISEWYMISIDQAILINMDFIDELNVYSAFTSICFLILTPIGSRLKSNDFSIGFILFDMLVQPYWTAFTDAWVKKDIDWIKDSIAKLLRIWKIISLCCMLILLLSPVIYKIWIGDSIHIPFILSAVMCLYFICKCYGGTYNMFINGTGKIRIQSITLAAMVLLYFPLAYLLAKILNIGLIAIPLSLIFTDIYSLFIAKIHYKRLINNKAAGLWNK